MNHLIVSIFETAAESRKNGWKKANPFAASTQINRYHSYEMGWYSEEVTKDDFLQLHGDMERLQAASDRGERFRHLEERLRVFDAIMNASPWRMYPPYGCVHKDDTPEHDLPAMPAHDQELSDAIAKAMGVLAKATMLVTNAKHHQEARAAWKGLHNVAGKYYSDPKVRAYGLICRDTNVDGTRVQAKISG